MNPIQAQVEALLRQTSAAHSVYEKSELNGVYDEDWTSWYADQALQNGLNDLLHTDFQLTDFAQLLEELNDAHQEATSGEDWAQFTARHLVESYLIDGESDS